MAKYRGGLDLSNELICVILDYLAADPDKDLGIEERAYLSQESFRPPIPRSHDQAANIGKFRLICKRYAELGAAQQFARVTTRFSSHGFARLEAISGESHLARHVKKFSYMVPYFYTEGRDNVQLLVPYLRQTAGNIDVDVYRRKIDEQRRIIRGQEDARVLKKAISAFTSLQHVQILRVQDSEDAKLLTFVRRHEEMAQYLELKWAPACLHSAKTIGNALLESQSPFSRFSSPMLSPQCAVILAEHPSGSFSKLAERLTCLELHFDDGVFDDGTDLEVRMTQLSPLFKTVFEAAVNMKAIHVGFPSHRPIGLPLETIFHNVRWGRLIAFGVQGWKLRADEIIGLASRHRDRIRGLRLRDVKLKEGSMWKDVLAFLHDEMVHLDWVSLRRIDYARHFDEIWENAGVEIPDDIPGGLSDSDSDSDGDSDEGSDDGSEEPHPADDHLDEEASDWGSLHMSESDAESDDEYGPYAHEMDFPPLNSPDTPNSAPWCNCSGRTWPLSVDDLGDDGIAVDNKTRKMWEKWVLGRCPEHDPR